MVVSSLNEAFQIDGINCVVRMLASRVISAASGWVVPAGRGARPQVAVYFIGRPPGVSGGLVFAPRLIPRRVTVVPVAIEQGPSGIRTTWRYASGAGSTTTRPRPSRRRAHLQMVEWRFAPRTPSSSKSSTIRANTGDCERLR